jgi:hypothetical protein
MSDFRVGFPTCENSKVCPSATSEAGARPLEGQLSLQINE